MLTFFRRIRKGLLGSGATRKYLVYAAGEVLLVMIGILLALQVNNWNELRKTQSQVNVLLTNLVETVNDDVRWFERIQMANSFRVNSMTYVLKLAEVSYGVWESNNKNPMFDFEGIEIPDSNVIWNKPYPDTFDLKLFQLSMLWSGRPMYMVPNKTTIDELKSTGLLSSINNADLKEQINNYYNELEWQYSQVRENQQSLMIMPWLTLLRRLGINDYNVLNIEDPIKVIKEEVEISSYMIELINWAQTRQDLAGNNKRDALNLINDLKEELGE